MNICRKWGARLLPLAEDSGRGPFCNVYTMHRFLSGGKSIGRRNSN